MQASPVGQVVLHNSAMKDVTNNVEAFSSGKQNQLILFAYDDRSFSTDEKVILHIDL
jgi:hypothetical protein